MEPRVPSEGGIFHSLLAQPRSSQRRRKRLQVWGRDNGPNMSDWRDVSFLLRPSRMLVGVGRGRCQPLRSTWIKARRRDRSAHPQVAQPAANAEHSSRSQAGLGVFEQIRSIINTWFCSQKLGAIKGGWLHR